MKMPSNQSVMVSFRLDLETNNKIQEALKTYANKNTSVSDYCKDVITRYVWRHEPEGKAKAKMDKVTLSNLRETFGKLDEARGYRTTAKRAAEASSIVKMLKTYTPDQIIDTWKKLKAQPFYSDKELWMMTVEGQIGAVVNAKSCIPGEPLNSDIGGVNPEKFKNQKFGHMVQR